MRETVCVCVYERERECVCVWFSSSVLASEYLVFYPHHTSVCECVCDRPVSAEDLVNVQCFVMEAFCVLVWS